MVPLSVITEQLPVISAQLGIEQSTLTSFLTTAQPVAAPVAPGPHFPGVLLEAGFGIMSAAYFANLEAGGMEKARFGQTLVPVSITYETADVQSGGVIGATGAAIGT